MRIDLGASDSKSDTLQSELTWHLLVSLRVLDRMTHAQKLRRLIITDLKERRLIVLDPRDGSYLQTLPLPETVYSVRDMCLQGEDVIVLLHAEEATNNKKLHVSYFSIV